MTSAPQDLLAFRAAGRVITGLPAVEFGIVGDGAHQRTGGFHEGRDVLASIGRYHGPASANVGSSGEDYSARQARDRNGLTLSSSAADIGSAWRNGGRAAWLRFNTLLYREMVDHPERLPALRAINVSLDGSKKQRYDQLHRGGGLIASKDTVDSHTHLEFWRDTEGRRAATLDRIVELMRAAVAGTTPTASTGDDDMADTWAVSPNPRNPAFITQNAGRPWITDQQRDTVLAVGAAAANEASEKLDRVLAAAAAGEVRDKANTAALEVLGKAIDTILKAGGDVNGAALVAAVTNAVNVVRDEARVKFAELAEENLALQRELAAVRAAAEANLSPAEIAALDKL